MTNHPRQRAMWDGLTGTGCLGIVILFVLAAAIGVLVEWPIV
jgi:hypothetical protein